jgi:hypothetical protein
MINELTPCPFERSIVGMQGQYLVRHNREHEREAAKAIRRRNQPGWSRRRDDFRLEGMK